MRGKAVIAGVGHTAFGKLEGRSTVSLNIEAARKALADAGIDKSMVDGLQVRDDVRAKAGRGHGPDAAYRRRL